MVYIKHFPNVKRYASGSGFISTPETAIIGDNAMYPEAVLLKPEIEAVGTKGAAVMANTLNAKLSEHSEILSGIKDAITTLDTRFYVLEIKFH